MAKFKVLLTYLFFIYSCVTWGQKTQIQVSANLTGFKDSTKFYLVNLDSTQQKDSSYLINGKLKFNCTISEPQVFRLKTYFEKDFFTASPTVRDITQDQSKGLLAPPSPVSPKLQCRTKYLLLRRRPFLPVPGP